jgi:uncharacterized protein YndB with AHSA1/START domain
MVLKIIITISLVIGVFLVKVALQPANNSFSREIVIQTTPERVYSFLTNRELVNSWNPWLLKDKQAKISTEGPNEGVGSKTIWTDGKELGTGSATVVALIPNEKISVTLAYEKPFKMTQDATYLLRPQGDSTVVTWKVEGESPFLIRVVCSFMNMEKMMDETFMSGLNDLKSRLEKK